MGEAKGTKLKMMIYLMNYYVADTVNRVNDVERENLVVNVVTAADAELTL